MSNSDSSCNEEETPVSPTSLEVILGNLFCKENGEQMDFYMRPSRLFRRPNKSELKEKMLKLKSTIELYGGNLHKEPKGQHSIELLFPEMVIPEMDMDYDVFSTEYIEKCVESGDILELENFRIGESRYDSSVSITDILKGIKSWDSVKRKSRSSQGRKLPDFATNIQPVSTYRRSASPVKSSLTPIRKKKRVEYTIKEDTAILKFLIENNLCDKLGGYSTWMKVAKEFPHHTYQSLQNRYRRAILPNIDKYKELTESERNLFAHGSSSGSSRVYGSSDDSSSEEILCERLQEKKQILKDKNEIPQKEDLTSPKVVEESQSSDVKDSEMDSISDGNEHEAFESKKDGKPVQRKSLGRPYTIAEDRIILNYIVDNNRFEEIRGKRLWVDVQEGPLKPYGRSWESAKTRFRKNIMKDIESRHYQLEPATIEKFRRGLTVDRQMGGAKKMKKKKKSPKHPALCSTPKGSSSSSMQNKRRMLYNAPRIALPVVFSPHPPPHASKKRTVPVGVNMKKEVEHIAKEVDQEIVADSPVITKKLRVHLRRLTEEEIRKYCCESTSDEHLTEQEENRLQLENDSVKLQVNEAESDKDLTESKITAIEPSSDLTAPATDTVELEKDIAESQIITVEPDNDIIVSDKETIDSEKDLQESKTNTVEPENEQPESDADTVELEKDLVESERNTPEPEKDLAESGVNQMETEEILTESEDNFITAGNSAEESNPVVELDPIATIDLCIESSEPSSATPADDEIDKDQEISQESSESVIEASYELPSKHSDILNKSATNPIEQPETNSVPEPGTHSNIETESVIVISTSIPLFADRNTETKSLASKHGDIPTSLLPPVDLPDQRASVSRQSNEEIPLHIIDSEIELVEEIIVGEELEEKIIPSRSVEEVMLVDNSSDSEHYFTPRGIEKEDVDDIVADIHGMQQTRSNEKETVLNAVNNIFTALEELTERRKIERSIEEPDC